MKVTHTYRFLISLILTGVLLILGCSTEKDAWLNRSFHNTTAHYNGYFNAGEIIKEAMNNYASGRIEDYNVIIPVFEYADEVGSKSLYSAMDTAAAKCETVIGRHSMPEIKKGQFRKTEWCKWIDDNWLIIGQSQFYKRYLDSALKTFIFIEKQYYKEPIKYTGMLWQAKTYIEMENFEKAEDILKKLVEGKEELAALAKEKKQEEKKKKKKKSKSKSKSKSRKKHNNDDKTPPPYPKNFDNKIVLIYADLYLRQKNYPKAIEKLEEAIEVEKKRQFKTRLIFILAQVHHKLGNQEASELYAKVVKLNPKYEMTFQAKINRALAYSGGDNKSVKAQLLKMLRDDKNIDFLDQIYFALADITLREGDRPKGIEYLEFSVLSSTSNNEQKSKSFLRLGKLYYASKNYIKAQRYYDSTMTVLPKEHPEYNTIELQNISLTELVEQLNIITEQDSIVQFCNLSEKERISMIEDLIQYKKDENERLEEEKVNLTQIPFKGNTTGTPGGKFWVWDNNLKGMGFNDFKKVWGNRRLEDNWRRTDKNSTSGEEDNLGEELGERDEYTVEFYLKELPCDDDNKMQSSNEKIMAAMYEVGSIYKVKLKDQDAAKETFYTLTDRYLPKEKALAGLYQLYLLETGEQKNKHKDKIISDYPNSEYAKLILDPNYKQNEQLKQIKEKEEYSKIYKKYEQEQYPEVITNCDLIIEKDTTNTFLCNYYYLKALAISGKYSGVDSLGILENALSDVVNHCNGEAVYMPAKTALDKLRNITSVQDAIEGKSTYIFNPDLKHFFVLVFPNNSGNANGVKSKISNLNSASFSGKKLKTSSNFLDTDTQLILVKEFKSKKAALDYYIAFKVNKKQVKSLNKNYQYFVISNKNYASLMLEKDLDEYQTFFEENYAE